MCLFEGGFCLTVFVCGPCLSSLSILSLPSLSPSLPPSPLLGRGPRRNREGVNVLPRP